MKNIKMNYSKKMIKKIVCYLMCLSKTYNKPIEKKNEL